MLLLDTSFIVALENRDDRHHAKAWEIERQNIRDGVPYLLHWGILLEIGDGFARQVRREAGRRLLQRILTEDGYVIAPITQLLLDQAVALYHARTDKDWGLTDCLSFALMQQEGLTGALTSDVHYRQAGFQALLLDD